MKHYLLSFLLFGGAALAAHGQAPALFKGYPAAKWPSKPNPTSDDYKLSHDDFVTRYGVNDTAAAIVHMYLRKHNTGIRVVQVMSGLTAAAGYAASAQADVKARNAGKQVDPTNREYPGWITPVLIGGGGSVAWGLVQATLWSRKSCYNTLYRYHTTRTLPRKVSRRLTKFLIKTQNREFGD